MNPKFEFLGRTLDKVALIRSDKQRAVLSLLIIDRIYHHTSHSELARLLNLSPSGFNRLLGRGLAELGRLMREDPEFVEFLEEQGFNSELVAELFEGLFRPRTGE